MTAVCVLGYSNEPPGWRTLQRYRFLKAENHLEMTIKDVPGRPYRRMVALGRRRDRSIVSSARSAEKPVRPASPIRGHLAVGGVGLVEGKRRILDDLTFELDPGSINYLVDASAEEQSGLLTLLLGLETPAEGTIHLDGVGLDEMSLADRRTMVGLAVADPWMVQGSVAENIGFGHPAVSRSQIESAATLAGVDSFTAGLDDGLDTIVSEEGNELTLVERRLIGLARAVVREPALLLIDRPTKNLDSHAQATTIEAVQRVSEGRTTLIASPRRDLVKEADRILRIRGGNLVGSAQNRSTSASDTDWVRRRAFRRLDSTQSVSAINPEDEFVAGHQAMELIERSAHTETWLAWDRDAGRLVHIKLPRRSPATYVALEELTREFRTGELLTHPGLSRPLYAQFALAQPYSVYEHLQGPTLADLIASPDGRPDSATILRIGYELARTLSYFHQRGFAHLDLRPEIVVISPQGSVITDLKMALRLGDEQVRFYRRDQYGVLAAEQLRGGPAAASMDMFALGALLYQAANGVLATTANSSFGSRRASIESRPPRRRPAPRSLTRPSNGLQDHQPIDASEVISAIVERLTASDPEQRPTAEEVNNLLRPYVLPQPKAPGATAGSSVTWISSATDRVAS